MKKKKLKRELARAVYWEEQTEIALRMWQEQFHKLTEKVAADKESWGAQVNPIRLPRPLWLVLLNHPEVWQQDKMIVFHEIWYEEDLGRVR